MKQLTHKQTKAELAKMEQAANGGPRTWDLWYTSNKAARVYFPLGELTNPAITGFLWAWQMQGKIVVTPSQEMDKITSLNMNGLEGLIQVDTDLAVALMVYRDLPQYRSKVTVLD